VTELGSSRPRGGDRCRSVLLPTLRKSWSRRGRAPQLSRSGFADHDTLAALRAWLAHAHTQQDEHAGRRGEQRPEEDLDVLARA
jgi:hypothetical protein